MDSRGLIIGMIILLQTTVGILGNFFLLSHYLILYYHECSLKTTDLILKHLTMANTLIILSKGVSHIMTAFGLKEFISEIGCRFSLYVQRVGRSMSIGSTCILSVFQAITISPRSSDWKGLKTKAPKYIGLFLSLCWILYLIVNIIFPIYLLNKKVKSQNMTKAKSFEYCSPGDRDGIMDSLYMALFVFPEVLFSVLILWSNGFMVVILYRHKKQVQHIHSTNVSFRASPESRASCTILILVSFFLTFYTLSSILNACIAFLNSPSWWLVNINNIISMCFPSFGTLVLMNNAPTFSRFCFIWIRNKKSPNFKVAM
uniref:vomeronasal type-1 receptor 4-like n=1 Tax=Jaculus jaculus TaxID=51337 RepID=UPI000332FAC4|nr:vomeronasal type-1 receptor 4-like [Jaculus jaculus]